MEQKQESKGRAIASMILGILSLLKCYLGFFLGVVGLILASVSLGTHKACKGMAIAGLVTSILGVLWGLITFI
jgi:hypothetical protein